MLDTVEMRWILAGPLPETVERWFEAGHALPLEARTDRYVVMPQCPGLGIKLRDDGGGPVQVDVKASHGESIELRLTPSIVGRASAWSKWTLALTDRGAIVSGLDGTTPALVTHKRRRQRRFVPGEPPSERPPDADVEAGCDVELATIAVEGFAGRWWSLGFEAFGPADRPWEVLRAIAAAWFANHRALPDALASRLVLRSSNAYPSWLIERLTENDGA